MIGHISRLCFASLMCLGASTAYAATAVPGQTSSSPMQASLMCAAVAVVTGRCCGGSGFHAGGGFHEGGGFHDGGGFTGARMDRTVCPLEL